MGPSQKQRNSKQNKSNTNTIGVGRDVNPTIRKELIIMTIKEHLIEMGYSNEMASAKETGDSFGTNWRDRPRFRLKDGKLQWCEHRCISSFHFGGSCQCMSHRPESWINI